MPPSTRRATDHRQYAMVVAVVVVVAAAAVAVAAAVVVTTFADYVAARHRSSISLCPQLWPRALPKQETNRV